MRKANNRIDITGQRFGRLCATGKTITKNQRIFWECVCDCGNVKFYESYSLRHGYSRSCGCWCKEEMARIKHKHGAAGTRLYGVWFKMLERCRNPKNKRFHRYGGRGISVCNRWQSFQNWIDDMGYPASDTLEIDRINNDGNYEPGNCRWATKKQNCRNSSSARKITYLGKTQCITEWAEDAGINEKTLMTRLERGWPFVKAIETPVKKIA
jgi:hypothetical protein